MPVKAASAMPKQTTSPPPDPASRYTRGGGLTREERLSRQQLRMEAAGWFDRGEKSSVIAREFGVHVRSVEKWRRDWRDGGAKALHAQGNRAASRLSDAEFAALEAALLDGPMPQGWPDQRWTLSRIAAVVERMFHVSYTIQGVRKLLLRHGYSHRLGGRQAVEPCHGPVTGWVKDTWPSAHTAAADGERTDAEA
ncbi:winged helix-turn-helix domain-containing protein [Streptomyces sp. NBC_01764]|uniref:helix-turn-helix domain-containing protein n=2 Tax=unclassified Streptomyces TaxID=2593676 RepID=UPI002B1CCC40|nr:winged helix-turn-helix domain-containing protein [Streptomyces sp. NBC_01764]